MSQKKSQKDSQDRRATPTPRAKRRAGKLPGVIYGDTPKRPTIADLKANQARKLVERWREQLGLNRLLRSRLESPQEESIPKRELLTALENFSAAARDHLQNNSIDEKQAYVGVVARRLEDDLLGGAVTLVPPPAVAPKLWKHRDKTKRQNPLDFISETYSKWLGHGLTQAELKRLDVSLYTAFHNYLRTNPILPSGFYLPSKEEWTTRLFQERRLFEQLNTDEKADVLIATGYRLKRL
jgi:hypothetical protein